MLVSTLFLIQSLLAQGALLTLENVELKFYYDNTVGKGQGGQCARERGERLTWQDAVLDDMGACEGPRYKDSQDGRMLALGTSLGHKQYCGRRVRITRPDGTVLKIQGDDFYVKDGCGGCGSSQVDVSAAAMIQACGGSKCGVGNGQNPRGFKVEVLEDIHPGAVGLIPPQVQGGVANPVTVTNAAPAPGATTPAVQPVVTPAVVPPPSGASCACRLPGDFGCVGGQRAVCTYIDNNQPPTLGFQVVQGPCPAGCT